MTTSCGETVDAPCFVTVDPVNFDPILIGMALLLLLVAAVLVAQLRRP